MNKLKIPVLIASIMSMILLSHVEASEDNVLKEVEKKHKEVLEEFNCLKKELSSSDEALKAIGISEEQYTDFYDTAKSTKDRELLKTKARENLESYLEIESFKNPMDINLDLDFCLSNMGWYFQWLSQQYGN